MSSAKSAAVFGVCSDGLITAAFPPAIAPTCEMIRTEPDCETGRNVAHTKGVMHIMIGPLKGAMINTVPLGSGRTLGDIARKLRLNSAFWVAAHFSTPS